MKKEKFKLKCGVEVTFYNKRKFGEVSLINLYNGYGELSDFKKVAELFNELHEMGYTPSGMMREIGYYDSTDDIKLDFLLSK